MKTILGHIGCDAFVTEHADVRGLQEAVEQEADVVFLADDDRFVALNVKWGACADDEPLHCKRLRCRPWLRPRGD